MVLEFKLKGKTQQYRVIDEMIRTAQFVRNKTLRYWIENQGVKLIDLYKQCAIMAALFEWAGKLNSMVRQATARTCHFCYSTKRFFARIQDIRLEAFFPQEMFNIYGRFCCWNFQVSRQSGFAFLCTQRDASELG